MIKRALPIGLTPRDAVEYFRRKGYDVSFAWDDVLREAHAQSFTVAKMMRVDLLMDVRQRVDAAIEGGTTLEQFQRELTPFLQAKGWWGAQRMTNPATGEDQLVQLGSPRRIETIYDTNLRTALSAGRWKQIQETKAARPYLRYIHLDTAHPRPQHASWHGLVLLADDVFWHTHYPPNGWHCHCSVQQLNDRDLDRYGYALGKSPVIQTRAWENPSTGARRQVPIGIDPGFDYNAGMAGIAHYQQLLEDRLASVPPDLRDALRS